VEADGNRKIDEPKTPYVRYDAENDLVLGGQLNGASRAGRKLMTDVPGFDLRAGQTPRSPITPASQNGR
jgi:protein phosphatase inhibitor 2